MLPKSLIINVKLSFILEFNWFDLNPPQTKFIGDEKHTVEWIKSYRIFLDIWFENN